MPISESCSNDDILAALRAHEERIGQIVLDTRPKIQQMRTMASDLDTTVLTPMENKLDSILSAVSLTTKDLTAMSGFQTGATKAEIEKSLAETFGINVVNGKVLVTDDGDVDLTAVQDLTRLLGSFRAVKDVAPEYATCPDSSDMLAGMQIPPRFIIVTTTMQVTLIPGVGCKADSERVDEITLGVDKPLQEVLVAHPELTRADLIVYVFWFGKPQSRPDLRNKALSFGLNETEYFDAVLVRSTETFKVKVIEDPVVQICKFGATLGDDAETVLQRNFGNKKPKIKLTPTLQDITNQIRKSGILTVQPGRTNQYGLKDYGSPALQFLAVVDFEKTFGSKQKGTDNCLDTSLDLSAITDGLFGAMNSVSNAINTLINEAISSFMWLLNKITSIFSVIDAFLFKLLRCLFPAGTMNFSLSGGPLKDLVDLMQDGLKMFQALFRALGDILNVMGPLACIKASLADLAKQFTSLIPGLACILNLFSFDLCLGLSVDIGQLEGEMAFAALAAALNNLAALFSILSALITGFAANFSLAHCMPVESAILMAKLGIRAAAASAGIPL
jgi:hypothetical protein